MSKSPAIFLVMLLSFALTVMIFVFLVRKVPPNRRLLTYGFGLAASCLWLGLLKGLVATVIAIAFTSGYVSTRLDARRIGKRVAEELDVAPNLFLSALEQVLPMYLSMLAQLEHQGRGVQHCTRILLPHYLLGLDALESRFGHQNLIEQARKRALQYQASPPSEA